jgi:hypothetical protein
MKYMMEVFGLLSEKAVLRQMKEELERALHMDDVQKQREHVRAVRSMCDLFMQGDSPAKVQTPEPKRSEPSAEPSAAEWAAMTGEWPVQQPKKTFEDDDEESNGKSLFDF